MAASKPKKWNYRLIITIEVLILIVLMIFYGLWTMNQKMNSIDFNDLTDDDIEVNDNLNKDMAGYTDIVLFGGDSRDGTVEKGTHSDTVIIVNLNHETKEVRLVSVYRDTFLEIAKENPNNQKLTHAHFIGGPKMGINTLNRNFDLDIKDYVTVNFEAVTKAVDVLGGIEVEVKKNEVKWFNKNIKEQNKIFGENTPLLEGAGTYTMNGTQALAYARIRKTDQGDITRTERQRKVISLMVAKLKTQGLTKMTELMDAVFPMISTSISKTEMISLATQVFSYELKDTIGFPFTFTNASPGSKGAVLPPADLEHNVMALHKYLYGTENYQVSDTVKRINQSIAAETGASYIPINILEEAGAGGGAGGTSEDASGQTVQ